MIQLGEFLQVISLVIYAGALVLSILRFSSMRKSMLVQNMRKHMQLLHKLFFSSLSHREYLEMSQESPVVSQYYSFTGSPRQYYIITQTFDMFEYIFRLYKTKMIDEEQSLRSTAKSIITIPKFKKVWDKTKDSRSHEFIKLIDSFGISQNF